MIERRAQRSRTVAWMTATACAGWLVLAASLHAQVATGTILGNVKDNSGAPVPGALVTATNVDTQSSRTTTTDGDGQYALPLLPVGNYKVEVTLTGFKNFSQTGILLEVGRNARVDADDRARRRPGSRLGHRRRPARRDQLGRRSPGRSARTKS